MCILAGLPVLESIGNHALAAFYGAILGWTLIEISVEFIHILIDRLYENIEDLKVGLLEDHVGLLKIQNGFLVVGAPIDAIIFPHVGFVVLIAQGYTLMVYFSIALFVVPLLTVRILRIWNADYGSNLFGSDDAHAATLHLDDWVSHCFSSFTIGISRSRSLPIPLDSYPSEYHHSLPVFS